jgi:dihydrolipoamide dehydrogenase
VESRGTLGGTCLNVGCIPSKALLHSSHLYEHAKKDFKAHGVVVGDVSVDLSVMMDAKAKSVRGLTGGIEHLLKKNKVDYVKGKGSLGAERGVVTAALAGGGTATLRAKHIIIATGSEPTPIPPCPVDNAAGVIVDSTGALALKAIPKRLAVIGGGVIGLEMGSIWRRLGTEVTVVEFLDRITASMDVELSGAFQKILAKQGMKFKLGTKVVSASPGAGCCRVPRGSPRLPSPPSNRRASASRMRSCARASRRCTGPRASSDSTKKSA